VSFKYGLFVEPNADNYLELHIKPLNGKELPVSSFTARDHAEATLERRLEKYKLCRKFCGMDACSKPDACLYQQIHLCKGAGIGLEKPAAYNERVEQLLADIAYGLPSFFVIGEGRNYDERSVVCVENGAYRGYTYMDASLTTASPEEIRAAIKLRPETPDVQQIIRRYIKQKPKEVRRM
jgi:DNA polymerase-3 subunit epsilon